MTNSKLVIIQTEALKALVAHTRGADYSQTFPYISTLMDLELLEYNGSNYAITELGKQLIQAFMDNQFSLDKGSIIISMSGNDD